MGLLDEAVLHCPVGWDCRVDFVSQCNTTAFFEGGKCDSEEWKLLGTEIQKYRILTGLFDFF
jgi:hypothetical protein